MWAARAPIGVILAGGLGTRIGGSKAMVELKGRPLIAYPCEALRQALGETAILAKADTELPSLPGVSVWVEPPTPRHPLIGIMHALSLAEGRSIVVCPLDLPFLAPDIVHQLAEADAWGHAAVIAAAGDRTEPLLGCYRPVALERLQRAGVPADAPVPEAVARIGARVLEVAPLALFNVDSPDDLLQAAAMLDRMEAPSPRRS